MDKNEEMQILLKEIDSFLVSNPDKNGMGIAQGGYRHIYDLLYTLKGEGVIGSLEDEELPINNKKDAWEDTVYFFDIDRERFEKFKKGIRDSMAKKLFPTKYDSKKMVLNYQNKEIYIPAETNISAFCKYMFSKKINTLISWDVIYEAIAEDAPNDKVKNRKKIYDAMLAVNKRIDKIFPGQIVFDWRGKSVVRVS